MCFLFFLFYLSRRSLKAFLRKKKKKTQERKIHLNMTMETLYFLRHRSISFFFLVIKPSYIVFYILHIDDSERIQRVTKNNEVFEILL